MSKGWWNVVSCLLFVALPGMLSAQGAFCGEYDNWVCNGSETGDHMVSGPYGGPVDGTHGDCRFYANEWMFEHISCNPEEAPQAAYEQALIAFAALDVNALAASYEGLDGLLVFNRERKALQLWDCRRTGIVATIRLRASDLAMLEELLED